jgi:hypothetical protein
VSEAFLPVLAGHAAGADVPAPATPKNVPYHGGGTNPSAAGLA